MKTLIIFIFLLAMSRTACPQDIALGRLFHTPEQRFGLDQQRQRGISPSLVGDNGRPITLNGQVIRSSGRDMAWVNGSPVSGEEARTMLPYPLRAGETAMGARRSDTRDLLNGGKITIQRNNESR